MSASPANAERAHASALRIIFMGTPAFALPSLRILLENQYTLPAVVTVPDKHAGRGQMLSPSPVKVLAAKSGIPVLQPDRLDEPSFVDQLKRYEADLFVVVAFRILPEVLIGIPRLGAFNLHASLLPKYRGAAPINWAIMNGEDETGVTTFFLQRTVDTGNIILQARVPIGDEETSGELHDKLSEVGAEIVLHSVRLIEAGRVQRTIQDDSQASAAPKIFKEHCRINWTCSSSRVHNQIRGLSPKPGAYTYHGETHIKVLRSGIRDAKDFAPVPVPGTVIRSGHAVLVATGDGIVELLELQQEGKKRLSADEFLRGYHLNTGDRFH